MARKLGILEKLDALSYVALLGLWVASILFFAAVFYFLSFLAPIASSNGVFVHSFWEFVYFSIVTATSTGYGDIIPIGIGRAAAGTEIFVGILLFALFISKFLSRRQDAAMQEVHRLSFQSAFHNTREDLFIARRDLDRVIVYLTENRALNERHRDELLIALQQICHLFRELPDFYGDEDHHYSLDERRERLLIEAASRTLSRVSETVRLLKDAHALTGEIIEEIRPIAAISKEIAVFWEKSQETNTLAVARKAIEALEKI